MIFRYFIDDSLMVFDETHFSLKWKSLEKMDYTLLQQQKVINVCDVQCRIDASLMLMTATIMNHQCEQCLCDWG